MMSHDFKINECNKRMYVNDTEHIYVSMTKVGDMLIVNNNDKMITSTKYIFNSRFDMKDLRFIDVTLGIKIKIKTLDGLNLTQSHYVDNILVKFNKNNFVTAKILVHITLHLPKNKGESVSQVEYSRVIGSIMYLMSYAKPDIACDVNKLSKYTSNLGVKH